MPELVHWLGIYRLSLDPRWRWLTMSIHPSLRTSQALR